MHDCAPAFGIQVSFSVNQQLARLRTAIRGSVMQSGILVTRTKIYQKRISKTQYKTKSATNFKHKCAHALCIQVSFPMNQQLARLCVAIRGSEMQSGLLKTEQKIRSKF